MGSMNSFSPSKEQEPKPAPHGHKSSKQVVLLASSWVNNCKKKHEKGSLVKSQALLLYLHHQHSLERSPVKNSLRRAFPWHQQPWGRTHGLGMIPSWARQRGDQKRVNVLRLGRGHLTAACPHFRGCQGTLPWGKEEGGGICAWAQLEWFAISHREL